MCLVPAPAAHAVTHHPDLYRAILFRVEEAPAGGSSGNDDLRFDGFEAAAVARHVGSPAEDGFVVADVTPTYDGPAMSIRRLTSSGRAAAEAFRSDTVWNRAKDRVVKPAVRRTVTMLAAEAWSQAKEQIDRVLP